MLTIKYTAKSEQSLHDIARYTEKRWGRRQRIKYLASLDAAVKYLALYPMSGTLRKDLVADMYSYREGSHIIFYKLPDKQIHIIDILHERMDTRIHLSVL